MSNIKPSHTIETTRDFLNSHLGAKVTQLHLINRGETSQAFSFNCKENNYVIRFNHFKEGFLRDDYAHKTLAGLGLPIPKIIEISMFNEMYFAISEQVSGKNLMAYTPDIIERIIPSLMEMLIKLHSVKVDSTVGYGPIDEMGNGLYPSWSDYLEGSYSEEQTGFWQGWTELFEDTFLEKNVFDLIQSRMMQKAKYCHSIREFVHGDFSLDNILSDSQTVTGIVDWANSKYGDGLFDIAWFHFWTPMFNLPERIFKCYKEKNMTLPNFEERLLCHTYYLGLDALRFYAKTGRKEAYTQVREQLLSL